MEVGWNEARMDEGVTDGHSHNSSMSDTHEEIREVEIEYSRRIDGMHITSATAAPKAD